MKTETLLDLLQKITIHDIVEMGEDVNGNPIFALRVENQACSLILGDMNISDFSEWN